MLRITPRADADLEATWNYIARDGESAANRIEAELHASMQLLGEFPGIGHTRTDAPDRYRFWRVHSYLIAYRVEQEAVVVVRVVHGSRRMREQMDE